YVNAKKIVLACEFANPESFAGERRTLRQPAQLHGNNGVSLDRRLRYVQGANFCTYPLTSAKSGLALKYHLRSNSGSNGPIAKECHRFLVVGPFKFQAFGLDLRNALNRFPVLGCFNPNALIPRGRESAGRKEPAVNRTLALVLCTDRRSRGMVDLLKIVASTRQRLGAAP